MEDKFQNLLEQFHHHQLSKDDLMALFEWINSPEGAAEYDHYLSDQMETLEGESLKPFSLDTEKMLRKAKKKGNIKTPLVLRWPEIGKYAAILIVALLTGGAATWWFNEKSEAGKNDVVFAVSAGHKGTLTLPDGSEVWLNSESSVTYPAFGKRRIRLEGEVYLQVSKDKEHPFVVSTPYADIIVYGTQFNVSAFPDDSIVNVSLIEGSVGIRIAGQKAITRIVPGQVAQLNARNGHLNINDKDLSDIALWRNETLQIINEDPAALCRKMETWYGVNIRLTNSPQWNHKYNMTIRHETIEEMLALINKLTPIRFTIQEKEVTIEYIKK
jgi:ferric-dicitrate binding protein FerR (iron transport regulator)